MIAAVTDDELLLSRMGKVMDSQYIARRIAVLHVSADVYYFTFMDIPSLGG